MRFSAPGKVLWAGEYAVLDGEPAVVCAVNRRVTGKLMSGPQPLSPFLAAVRDELSGSAAVAAGRVRVDSSALAQGGIKLGLGSSAAATVAAAAAALGSADPALVHPVAHRAHAAAQAPRGSRGSGADIAASVHGGLVEVQRVDPDSDVLPLRVRRLALPEGLTVVLVWTGVAADTPTLVARVRQLKERDPAAAAACRARLGAAARQVIAAVENTNGSAVIVAMREAGQALAEYGDRSGAALVPAQLASLLALAERHGGTAKPTGAGGGDQILAVFASPDQAAGFRAAARDAGNTLIDADLDPHGVRLDVAPETS